MNKTILLTPNERLSEQHVNEFALSKMNGEIFRKDAPSLFQADRIEVIDINKLKGESKQKTVDVEAFEGNNLVLVDEGHRGATGESSAWMGYRAQLCAQGFSFEYSATFGQAMQATNNPNLPSQYAKCILFDYSYKHFYRDGYGKQYQILNLSDFNSEDSRQLYLTACLLAFYQQLRVFQDFGAEMRKYNLEKPLWVFVASRVTQAVSKQEVSDVIDVLLFLAAFLRAENRPLVLGRLQDLVSGNAALLDRQDRPLFKNAFAYLASLRLTPGQVYADVISLLFNASQAGSLRVSLLKDAEGELALQIGENRPFGVINVGDAGALYKACRERSELQADSQAVGDSLFADINRDQSPINVLIGAKRFTEGWNSFRVSTMGLMNVGQTEGAQIIQLFGRGVRLWGKDFSLTRSGSLPGIPRYLPLLEKLYVFGLRADYMDRFRDFLEKEGVPANPIDLMIPIVKRKWPERLRVLRVQDFDFKKDGAKPTLSAWPEERPDPVRLDWYPHVFQISAQTDEEAATARNAAKLSGAHTAFMDMDRIYFELHRFKSEKGWYNLNLPRSAVTGLLNDASWYTLLIPSAVLEVRSFAQVREWEQIAIALLKKYCEKFYNYKRAEAEAPHMKYIELKPTDENFIEGDQYFVRLDEQEQTLKGQIEELAGTIQKLREAIAKGDFAGIAGIPFAKGFKPIFFSEHLYHPLIAASGIEVRPMALNEGERQFVEDLKSYYQAQKSGFFLDKELYLLRNRTRGHGMGFFEAGNFYPDFIVWILHQGLQYITFVDPKGIRNEPGLNAPKLQFHKTIKKKQGGLGDDKIVLNSFILSRTAFDEIRHFEGGVSKQQVEAANVLFLGDGGRAYLAKMFQAIVPN
jgi:hypothetical protein